MFGSNAADTLLSIVRSTASSRSKTFFNSAFAVGKNDPSSFDRYSSEVRNALRISTLFSIAFTVFFSVSVYKKWCECCTNHMKQSIFFFFFASLPEIFVFNR